MVNQGLDIGERWEAVPEASVRALLALPLPVEVFVSTSLSAPGSFRERMDDQHSVRSSEVAREVSISYDVRKHIEAETGEEPDHIVCLVRPVKGRHLRGFVVRGRTGGNLRLLGLNERRRLLLEHLSTSLERLRGASPNAGELELLARLILINIPLIRGSADRKSLQADAAKFAAAQLGLHEDSTLQKAFLETVGIIAVRDPVLVVVPSGEAGRLTYSQIDPFASAELGMRRRFENTAWLAQALGAVPNVLYFRRYKTSVADEYAMEILFSPSSFVAELSTIGDQGEIRSRGRGSNRVLVEPSEEDARDAGAVILVRVLELPGGTLFRAALLALLVALLQWATIFAPFNVSERDPKTALETLASVFGILSVSFVATWAVIGRVADGRALDVYSVVSAFASSATLIGIVLFAAGTLDSPLWPTLLALLSLLNFATVSVVMWRRIALVQRLRRTDAALDPEGPSN